MLAAGKRVLQYVLFERNPIVQMVYILVMSAGYYVLNREMKNHIPNRYIGNYHILTFTIVFVACFLSFLHLSFLSDPGVITTNTLHTFRKYPFHPVLFPEDKYCQTCKIPKLPRSKHCRLCGCCVARFDHHCIWFNGCVGANNYKHFFGYLWLQLLMCLYGVFLVSTVFLTKAEEMLGIDPIFEGEDDMVMTTNRLSSAMHAIITQHQALGFLGSLMLMISLLLWFFILVQIYRIVQNATANESFKRDACYEKVSHDNDEESTRFSYMVYWTVLRRRIKGEMKTISKAGEKLLDHSWGGMFSTDSILNTEESFSYDDIQYNPYKMKRIWDNIKDAFKIGDAPFDKKSR